MTTDNRLSDSDLTVLVERAAEGVWDSKLPHVEGLVPWCDLHPASKNTYREQILPVISHGTKALHELGYRKPRTITTAEGLDALPVESVVRSDMGNVYVKDHYLDDPADTWWVTGGDVNAYRSSRVSLPAIVLYEPEAKVAA